MNIKKCNVRQHYKIWGGKRAANLDNVSVLKNLNNPKNEL